MKGTARVIPVLHGAKGLVFLILLLSPAGAAWAEDVPGSVSRQTAIYPVMQGDPDILEQAAQAIAGEDGLVFLDRRGNRLIVLATPDRHEAIRDLMGQITAQSGNVRIEVRFRERSSERDSGFSLSGEGGIVIGPGGTQGAVVLRPEVRNQVTRQSRDTLQMLVVASGGEARLQVGERVPHIEWIMEYGWRGGHIRTGLAWQDVGSFLVVAPTILGDGNTVRIRLIPELRGRVDGHPYHTRFATLSTDVIVRDGQTFPLGGTAEHREFYSRFLIGFDRSGRESVLDIDLTPRILRTHVMDP